MANNGDTEQTAYPAAKARQGEIVLRTPLRRMIFLAGFVGMVLVAALWLVLSR
ncbi:MAG: peptide ABC transporter permease [Methylovirgula sp.]